MKNPIPLAWKNLTHDLRNLLLAVSGIGFAVMLMFQQRGFSDALFDSTVAIVRDLDADIVLVNPARFALSNEVRFPTSVLDIVASQPNVAFVEPLFIENLAARLRRESLRARPIRVVGFSIDRSPFLDRRGEIGPKLEALREPNTAIMDRLSKSNYGFQLVSDWKTPQDGELCGKLLRVVGSFRSGRDFAHDGNLLMSKENFANYFPYRGIDPLSVVDLGLVKLNEISEVTTTQKALQEIFGDEVAVYTRQQFIDKEISFWSSNTPIGSIFMIGTVMGFVVGVIICYQILANNITEHMPEFATLKAMGYTNHYFLILVIKQAVLLATLGFIPGLLCSFMLFYFNSIMTGLIMEPTPFRIGLVFAATMAMCILSGLLALRKLLSADPASLF